MTATRAGRRAVGASTRRARRALLRIATRLLLPAGMAVAGVVAPHTAAAAAVAAAKATATANAPAAARAGTADRGTTPSAGASRPTPSAGTPPAGPSGTPDAGAPVPAPVRAGRTAAAPGPGPDTVEAAGAAAPPDPALRAAIADALVRRDGAGFAAHRWPHEPEIVALYFGADWCAPCHAFVPTLREVRDALQAAGADTEVVYVGLDETPSDMARYMRRQRMPWPAIDHRRLRTLPAVRALSGLAPPNLVLVDREGRVLADAWDGRRRVGLEAVLRRWLTSFAPAPVDDDPGDPGHANQTDEAGEADGRGDPPR